MAAENSQMKLSREAAEKLGNSKIDMVGDWPCIDGFPMVKISAAAAELIPTVQFGNVTVGPIQVTCFVAPDGTTLFSEEGLITSLTEIQKICEAAVASERDTIKALTIAAGSR